MAAVDVVLASQGYPESTGPGVPIHGADVEAQALLVFHAGTSRQGKRLVTDGGRVLSVVGLGPDLPAAAARAYAAVDGIDALFVGPADLGFDLTARHDPRTVADCLPGVVAAARMAETLQQQPEHLDGTDALHPQRPAIRHRAKL